MEKTKVLLSDPQVLFREGIHFTISTEEDLEVTGETTNNEEAIAFIEADPPDIAILNVKNGKPDGPRVIRHIKRNSPSVSVMLLTDKHEEDSLFLAIKCGASAYIKKDINPEHLIELIRMVAQGGQPINESLLIPTIASRILEEFDTFSPLSEQLGDTLARLSSREIAVLSSIAAGDDIEQIAINLDSDEETVRRHLRSITDKLVANDQARFVFEVAQQGIPSIIPRLDPTAVYVTREEFNKFKEALAERFRSLIIESHRTI
jgi:DNA-binding NarL/FixJ family response regulator